MSFQINLYKTCVFPIFSYLKLVCIQEITQLLTELVNDKWVNQIKSDLQKFLDNQTYKTFFRFAQ